MNSMMNATHMLKQVFVVLVHVEDSVSVHVEVIHGCNPHSAALLYTLKPARMHVNNIVWEVR